MIKYQKIDINSMGTFGMKSRFIVNNVHYFMFKVEVKHE